jgi:hypothetical protein
MSQKYYGRAPSTISRDTSSTESAGREPSWFSDFVNNFEKEAVKSKKDDYSLFDQINNILGNKSKYSSVEEAVLDMQSRTGLLGLLTQRKQAQVETDQKHQNSKLLNEIPSLKTYIDNYVEDRPGTSVDAVVHDLLKVRSIKEKLPEGDDVPEEIRRYINDKITEINMQRPSTGEEDLELGKIDLDTDENTASDNDPFGGCTPAVDAK